MEYIVINFMDRLNEPVISHNFSDEDCTIKDRALTPRQLLDRINHGIISEVDLQRPLTNDDNAPLSTIEMFPDEMDLANTQAFLQEVKDKTSTAVEEIRSKLSFDADPVEHSDKSVNEINNSNMSKS